MNGYRGHYNWHARMRRTLLGPAANHPCADGCGQQAEQWSLNAEHCQVGVEWVYVEDVSAYSARCRSCHRTQDAPFRVFTDDTRAKLSVAQQKRFEGGMPAETRAKIVRATAGIPKSDETRRRMSIAAQLRYIL